MRVRWDVRCGSFLAALLSVAGIAPAFDGIHTGGPPHGQGVAGPVSDAFGTGLSSQVIGSYLFESFYPDGRVVPVNGIDRFIETNPGGVIAHPILPNGAQVERVEVTACDTSSSATVTLAFARCHPQLVGCQLLAQVDTGFGPTPGCNAYSAPVVPPYVVDNEDYVMAVQVSTGTSAATTFSAVRVFYRLRVSPAPATATFTDVPSTHPFFRFVEALAAAGITGGCGGGNYCPEAALTRGEMAVFLSSALGLHFPN